MNNPEKISKQIVDGLSELIMQKLQAISAEEHCPRLDADASDDLIKELRNQANRLRALRAHFEETVTKTDL